MIDVSIHAPVMGANKRKRGQLAKCAVSIHAPVMGAKSGGCYWFLLCSFNPRTRDGCEVISPITLTSFDVSIHAPVMGANDDHAIDRAAHWCFNPRTRDGCEVISPITLTSFDVSIHAPVMGAKWVSAPALSWQLFQSTHP